MPDDHTTDDIVHESALQLWAAAQTDFDPFEVPPEEWGPNVVPVRDADIAHDTHLDLGGRARVDRAAGGLAPRRGAGGVRRRGHPDRPGRRAALSSAYSPSILPMISFWISVVPP